MLVAALLLGGCSYGFEASGFGENPARTRAYAHCRTVPLGVVYEKVKLHTAKISCWEAIVIFEDGRARESGRPPRRFEATDENGIVWICGRLPHSKQPVFERCRRKGRYFTIERRAVPAISRRVEAEILTPWW